MALVGTISGSNGTSNTAITGTLVIADRSAGFSTLPSDAVLFVSGTVGGNKKVVFGGDLVVSGATDIKNNVTGTNVLLNGSLAVNGGSITTTQTTLTIGGPSTTGSFQGAITIDGNATFSTVTEKLSLSVGGTGTVSYDLSQASVFYVNGPAGNITANFTNVPTTNNRVITPTVILSQSATARIVNAIQIDTSAVTINWANGITPTGNANKQDVFGFSLIRSGSAWKALGQMSSYG